MYAPEWGPAQDVCACIECMRAAVVCVVDAVAMVATACIPRFAPCRSAAPSH